MSTHYLLVRLLNGFNKPLLYTVDNNQTDLTGTIVEVPLRNNVQAALVIKVLTKKPKVAYPIRAIAGVQAMPDDERYHQFLTTLSRLYDTTPLHFYQRLRSFIKGDKSVKKGELSSHFSTIDSHSSTIDSHSSLSGISTDKRDPGQAGVTDDEDPDLRQGDSSDDQDEVLYDTSYQPTATAVTLTDEQQLAVDAMAPVVATPRFAPHLLHGVTGSGKTEVYLALMRIALQHNRSILFLCPEISLARRFEAVLRDQLPDDTQVQGFYSGVKKSEKDALWQRVLQGKPVVVVGVHLPVLLPLRDLGLIIIDEEHESGFAEKKHPKVNSKHAALLRAQQYGVPIVLGSATPSVATWYHAKQQQWPVFRLTKRFAGAFPTMQHVVLGPKHKRQHFWFSPQLLNAIEQKLAKGEQIILFVNRRGFSSCAQCTSCGEMFSCSNCDITMKVHMHTDAGGNQSAELRCHYCNAAQLMPPRCPQCKAPGSDLHYKGIGTQQVVTQLQKIFKTARIARADTDISRSKKAWRETIEKFEQHELDILVGTQIITKGYHFPRVTLVGVLWGDSGLHFPTFDAHEIALQQLLQVAGRAGRATASGKDSRVIVQSFAEHEIFNYLSEEKYAQFCAQELKNREESSYPPYGRLLQVELKNSDLRQLESDVALLANRLRKVAGDEVMVLGPAQPPVAKIARQHLRQLLLKAENFKALYAAWESVKRDDIPSSVVISPQ